MWEKLQDLGALLLIILVIWAMWAKPNPKFQLVNKQTGEVVEFSRTDEIRATGIQYDHGDYHNDYYWTEDRFGVVTKYTKSEWDIRDKPKE